MFSYQPSRAASVIRATSCSVIHGPADVTLRFSMLTGLLLLLGVEARDSDRIDVRAVEEEVLFERAFDLPARLLEDPRRSAVRGVVIRHHPVQPQLPEDVLLDALQ